jgi:predicted Zn-dependent peptidase
VPTRSPAVVPTLAHETLANGLQVVVHSDRAAPSVGVAVYYDVGFRSEPEGRTGFAHLFEHLMFQGSENVGKMEHPRLVQGAGGVMNGSTHPDFTNYFEAVPSNALELTLWLEADRMRAPTITAENLANQVAVVQNEIRVNVMNRPYGGFPWITLPPVAFETFANAHNGYGDFRELEAATVEDCRDFFRTYYAPANAVLGISGDVDPDAALALVHEHFDAVPKRRAPKRPSLAEAPPTTERRGEVTDEHATAPAFAVAWHAPDPAADPPAHLATAVLAEVLAEGDAGRLQDRLLLRDRSAVSVEAYLGTFGDPFEQRDPMLFTISVTHPPQRDGETVLATVQEELDALATDGLRAGELDRVLARLRAQLLRQRDQVIGRTLALTQFQQQHGSAERLWELDELIAGVSAEQVRAAAAALTTDSRSVLVLHAGGSR